jgi:hypothetical protein
MTHEGPSCDQSEDRLYSAACNVELNLISGALSDLLDNLPLVERVRLCASANVLAHPIAQLLKVVADYFPDRQNAPKTSDCRERIATDLYRILPDLLREQTNISVLNGIAEIRDTSPDLLSILEVIATHVRNIPLATGRTQD